MKIASIFLLMLLWFSTIAVHAQESIAKVPKTFDLFGDEEPLKVQLEFDIKQFIKQKYQDEYQPAKLRIFLNDSGYVERNIRIRPRGEFRRRYCNMPPIKLNFKESAFGNEQMDQLTTLKMVSVCKGSAAYQQYVVQEHLVYQLYNQLTEKSFRTRLMEVTLMDSRGKRKPQTNYGFVIEDIDQLAARNNAFELELDNIHPNETNQWTAAVMDVFQFMIGNTDYQPFNLHNVKLIKSNDHQDFNPYMVPYDFDYSGIINTLYAIPSDRLGIENVRERLYRGYCQDEETFQAVFDLFNDKKEAMLSIYENCPYISKNTRSYSLKYLEDFFTIINNDNLANREIISACK